MPTETEQKTTQQPEASLEDALSTEEEKVSEETPGEGQPEDTKEEKEPEETKPTKPDPALESRIQAEADKRVQSYRATRESDTALIRKLTDENRTLKNQTSAKAASSLIKSILSEDEEKGITPEETKSREQALKEFVEKYDKNSSEVEKAAEVVNDIITKIPGEVVKAFELNDPNPSVRAVNITKLVAEAASFINQSHDFLMVVEAFFPNGGEVRQKLDTIIEGMKDYENEKSKKLYLESQVKGLKLAPKKAPPAPSGTLGGRDWSKATTEEIVAEGLREAQKNRRK